MEAGLREGGAVTAEWWALLRVIGDGKKQSPC